MESWFYLGKKYTWTKDAIFKGEIDCTCARCFKYVKGLVEDGQLMQEIEKK